MHGTGCKLREHESIRELNVISLPVHRLSKISSKFFYGVIGVGLVFMSASNY